MRLSISLSAILLLALGLAAQQKVPPFRLPESVELKPDVVFARYGQREVRLDLYLPKQGAGPFPAVVYLFGGGWSQGTKQHFDRQAAYMATLGFVGACIDYRLSGEALFPAAVQDAKAAVRWLRANAKTYGIDPDRIGAAGGSSGGHLAAMLGVTHGVPEFEGDGGNPGVSSEVRAVAAFNPALDFEGIGTVYSRDATPAVTAFLGAAFTENPNLWRRAAPITYAGKGAAAFLFLHGTADQGVPYQQSVDMMNKLKAAGGRAEIFTAENAQHGFFNSPPWFEPTLQRMAEFFVRELQRDNLAH